MSSELNFILTQKIFASMTKSLQKITS